MGGHDPTGPKVSPMMSALIGGITGAIEISITYPTEYLKTCMQLYPEINKKGMVGYAKETWGSRGFFGKHQIIFQDFTKGTQLFYYFLYLKTM